MVSRTKVEDAIEFAVAGTVNEQIKEVAVAQLQHQISSGGCDDVGDSERKNFFVDALCVFVEQASFICAVEVFPAPIGAFQFPIIGAVKVIRREDNMVLFAKAPGRLDVQDVFGDISVLFQAFRQDFDFFSDADAKDICRAQKILHGLAN